MKDLHLPLNMPSKNSFVPGLRIATIIVAVLAIFHEDLAIIVNYALQTEFMSRIAIPFILVYIIYRKRKMLRAVILLDAQNEPEETKHLPTIAGILLSAIAVLSYWYSAGVFEYHILTLPIFAAGLILILFNYKTLKQLAFPIAFLISLLPPPSQIIYGLGLTLSQINAQASNTLLNALGIHSILSSEYGNPAIQIQRANGSEIPFVLDLEWSGIYSLILFVILSIFFIYIIRDKLWRRAAIFPISLSLFCLLNIAKTTLILLIGYYNGKETALQVFHLLDGWAVVFFGTALLFIITEKLLKTGISTKRVTTQCKHYAEQTNYLQNFCFACGRILKYPEVQLKRKDAEKMMAIIMAVALLLGANTIAQYWQPTETWTKIAIQISQNGNYLIAITSGLLMLVIALHNLERREERKMNGFTYQKLSKIDKQIVDTVRETEKTTTPTLNAITTQYQSITGTTIDKEKFIQKLSEAEKTHIVKSHIANQHDEPTQTWKTQLELKETPMRFGTSRLTVTIFLLLTGILINTITLFFLKLLDQVVHNELYRYGLQFSYEWAGQYWIYSNLMTDLLAVAITVTSISMAFTLVRARTHKIDSARTLKFPSVLLVIGIVTASFCAFFFNRLDYIVQNDLYKYGLQFSYEWAGQYWIYTRFILALLGIGIATSGASIVLILTGARPSEKELLLGAAPLKIDRVKLVCSILLSSGVMALIFSIYYNSSTIALIGLGLAFWGAILLYIRPGKYVEETLLDKTTLSSLSSLDQILGELGYKGKGVYLPPKYFNDFESTKVYFSAQEQAKLPSREQTQVQGNRMFLKNPEGILVTPLGIELTQLFEEKLGTSFIRVDLKYLEQNMAKLIVEDLEIAQSLQIETRGGSVHIKIENTIYRNVCIDVRKFSNICNSMGCPLCSAIACALAKATGKPVIIEEDIASEDGQTIDIEYRLLEEPS
jgi:exosortase